MITVGMNNVSNENNTALGNHMFQYCVCRLSAEKNGYNYYIPYSVYLSMCFPNIETGVKDGDIIHGYWEDHNIQRYDPNIFNIQDFTNISGFFQTEKYFRNEEDKIKSWFVVGKDINIDEVIDKYPIDKYCYVHIRGNDYVLSESWFLPKKYYQDGMNKVKELIPGISFVIITDDIQSSKNLFPNIDVISNSVPMDFKSLYNSKYCIMSSSSFSWWASWLSDKEIAIAPKNWLNYNNPERGFYPVDIETNKFTYV